MITGTASSSTPKNLEIEGIRAIAIVLVVLYHAGVPWCSGGFIGVDVFFVVSGFLITGQLNRELLRRGRIDLANFWARRARRLVPMSVVGILATVAVGALILPPVQKAQLLSAGTAALAFASNMYFIGASQDYFAAMNDQNPLLHTWSLGVEAQFYLVWPFVLIFSPSRLRLATVCVLAALSFLCSALLTPAQPTPAYYGLATRLWELAAGGILALAGEAIPSCAFLGWIGVAAIAIAAVAFSEHTAYPGYLAALPVLGAAALVSVARRDGFGWLGLRPVAYVGTLSYAWYLWHWPCIVYADRLLPGALGTIIAVALSFVLAVLTHHFVEAPARAWATRALKPWQTLTAGAVATAAAVAVVAALPKGVRG